MAGKEKMNFKQALIEGLKEAFRILLASATVVLPLAIIQLENNGSVDWRFLGISFLIAVLKGIDKTIHKYEGIKLNGLSPL